MKNISYILILFIVCIVALLLRTYNLEEQGFISWDEGMYMNEVLFYKSVSENIPEIVHKYKTNTFDKQYIENNIDGWPPSSAKPLHSLLIFSCSLFFGITIYVGQYLSALFGTACIIVLYFLISDMYNKNAGLYSAILLCISGYHVYISRLAVPETNSCFFFLLAWLCYWKSSKSNNKSKIWLIDLTGFLLGLSFITCYRWFVCMPIIWILILIDNNFNIIERIRRMARLTLSFIIMPLLCEIPYLPIRIANVLDASFAHMPAGLITYFDQLRYYLLLQSGYGSWHFHSLYVFFSLHFQGILLTLCIIMGLFFLLYKHRKKDILCLFPAMVLFVLLSVKTRGNAIRYISLGIPFALSWAGIFIERITSGYLKSDIKKIGIISFLAVIILFTQKKVYGDILFMQSGYKKAAQFVSGKRSLATMNPFFEFYLGRNVVEQTPSSDNKMKEILKKNEFKYVIIDFFSHRMLEKSLRNRILEQVMPLAQFDNKIGSSKITLMESLGYRHKNNDYIKNALDDPKSSKILIYAVEDILKVL